MRLFQADPDLRITGTAIYLDPSEPRALAVISHGHSDHIGRHSRFVATPPTASFVRSRLGADLAGDELPFGVPLEVDGCTITLYPAGHILGSAMVRVERGGHSLLYTGDFRLRPSWTAEPAEVPHADAVIMESTYGSPEWRFPSREEVGARLLDLVASIAARGKTPVLLAYSLGKAQEACSWLAANGIRVVVHPVVAQNNALYEKHGAPVGRYEIWSSQGALFANATSDLSGAAVIVPPHLDADVRRIPNRETVSLTGWALNGEFRQRADHSLPLSDHADFDELLELVDRAGPKVVYVTHGSSRFAGELRARGVAAEFVRKRQQMRLF